MLEVAVLNPDGSPATSILVRDDVFGIEPNRAVLHQAVVRQLANRRQGTVETKTRSTARGSTRKLWRQKGTGRARQGSRRAPHWTGGGLAHGPHPRSYRQAMPQKMRSLALRSALSDTVLEARLVVLEQLEMEQPSTRALRDVLMRVARARSVLLVLQDTLPTLRRSARNLPHVRTVGADSVSVLDLLQADRVVMAVPAVRRVEQRFPVPKPRPAAADRSVTDEPGPAQTVDGAGAADDEAPAASEPDS